MDCSLDLNLPKKARPFDGWALQQATILDIGGSRGFTADIATSSILRRQAIFCALASIDLDDPRPFLSHLGEERCVLGEVLLGRFPHEIVAAVFGIDAPKGYLRALMRIGHTPLAKPHLYRRLFEIFTDKAEHHKTHALRYCGPIDSTSVEVVDVLDRVIVHPEVVKHVRSLAKAQDANNLVRLLKDVCSFTTDDALIAGLSKALETGDLDDFAIKWIERADRLPPPPFSGQGDLVPLTSGPAIVKTGRSMNNCLRTRIGEVALGFAYYYRADVALPGGETTSIVVELEPLSNGTWIVTGLYGPHNREPADEVKAIVAKRLLRLGAVVASNPARHPHAKELARHLGVFRFGAFDTFSLDEEPNEMEALVDQIALEFGLDAA